MGEKVTVMNSNSSRNHVTNGCVISANMFTWKRVTMFTSQLEYMATAKCCLCLRCRKESWLLCRRVMFTTWGLTKATCRLSTFMAWVTQMFTSCQIGYAMETASVTINVEIWWLQSAWEIFRAWVKWIVTGNIIVSWQKHCKFYSMGDTNVYKLPNWLCGGDRLCNYQCLKSDGYDQLNLGFWC